MSIRYSRFPRASSAAPSRTVPNLTDQRHPHSSTKKLTMASRKKNTRRVGRQKQHQRYKLIRHIGQHKFPGQIHMVDHVRTQAREAGTQARQAAQQGMAPEGTRFQAYSSRHDTHLRKHTQITEICPHCKKSWLMSLRQRRPLPATAAPTPRQCTALPAPLHREFGQTHAAPRRPPARVGRRLGRQMPALSRPAAHTAPQRRYSPACLLCMLKYQ